MTDEMNTFEQMEQIVVAGASALREALGVPVTARDVQEVSDAQAGAPADGVVGRAVTSGGVVVAAGGAAELAAAGDPTSLMTSLASQIATAAGAVVESVDTAEDVAGAGLGAAAAVRFELTVGESAVPVMVAVESGVFDSAGASTVPPASDDPPSVSRAALPNLGMGALGNGERDLQVLADVTMKVTVELGHTRLPVRELLSLTEGSVVELDQAPGTPVEILVNGTPVAKGDVVVVEEDLGVRITEVLGKSLTA